MIDPIQEKGVGRVARLWIKQQTTNFKQQSRLVSSSEFRVSSGDAKQLEPNLETRNSKLETVFACVTTGLKPSEEVKKFCDDLGIGYLHLKIPNKIWTLGCMLGVFALDRAAERRLGKIDRVLLPNLGFVGRLATPYELLLHDVSFAIEPRWFGWRRRLWHALLPIRDLMRGAEMLHGVSERTLNDTVRLFGADPARCALFKFDPTSIREQPRRPVWLPDSANRFALLLGGADPRKNVRTALQALTAFNLRHPDQRIVPVVLGELTKNHAACIRPSGQATDAELAYLYKNATVFMYPSWYEGFGLPLHEAKFFNTPCLCSTAGALPETAPQGTIFCHPAKPHEWLSALEAVAKAGA